MHVKDAQIWVMLKTNSYKNKVESFVFQTTLLYNCSAEVCVKCWFQQYKISIKSFHSLSLHVFTLGSGISVQVHQVPFYLRIYITCMLKLLRSRS